MSRTRPFQLLLLVGLLAGDATNAPAQNSSLLHADSPGSVSQLPSPRPPSMLARPSGTGAPPAPLEVQIPRSSVSTPGASPVQSGVDRPPVFLNGASWTYQPAPPIRVFRKNDLVTIRVDEITRVMAEGGAETRKRTLYETILTDWIRLKDFRLRPDEQANGDPAVAAESNSNYRAESTVESRESMTFNIAATVVDIRPNGNLVLEARKAIRVNDNLWETSLSGICRAQDIAPDNVVLSKDLIDLEIRKEDRGHLRDGYKRGFLQRWLDRYAPF